MVYFLLFSTVEQKLGSSWIMDRAIQPHAVDACSSQQRELVKRAGLAEALPIVCPQEFAIQSRLWSTLKQTSTISISYSPKIALDAGTFL